VLVKGDQAGAYRLAANLPDELERRTIQWAAIYYGNGLIDYKRRGALAKDAPNSPRLPCENAHRAVPRNLQSE